MNEDDEVLEMLKMLKSDEHKKEMKEFGESFFFDDEIRKLIVDLEWYELLLAGEFLEGKSPTEIMTNDEDDSYLKNQLVFQTIQNRNFLESVERSLQGSVREFFDLLDKKDLTEKEKESKKRDLLLYRLFTEKDVEEPDEYSLGNDPTDEEKQQYRDYINKKILNRITETEPERDYDLLLNTDIDRDESTQKKVFQLVEMLIMMKDIEHSLLINKQNIIVRLKNFGILKADKIKDKEYE